MIDIIPGIFEKEWADVERKISLVSPHVEWVQIDVSDSTLVPESTCVQFGKLPESPFFEAHLMVADPVKYIRPFADSGFKRLIAHVESQDPRRFLDETKYESIEACLAIDASSEFDLLEPFIEEVDGILVMTGEIGEPGKKFMPETVEKIRLIRQAFADLPIEVEGGITDQIGKVVREAGATRIVSSHYIFQDPSTVAIAIERLKKA